MAPARTSSSKAASGDGTTTWRKRWYDGERRIVDSRVDGRAFVTDIEIIKRYPENWLVAYETASVVVAVSRKEIGVILYERQP